MNHHILPRRGVAVVSILAGLTLAAGCDSDDDAAADETTAPAAAPAPTAAPTATTEPITTEPITTAAATSPPSTPPSTTPSTTATPTTDAVEEWSIDAVGPGTFKTAVMEPGFTLTYGEGWVPFQPESRNQLNIEVPESTELGCAPCALLNVNTVKAESSDAVIDFAVGNGIEFADPEAIEVGGIEAERYEVIGGEGYVFETEFAAFGVDSAESSARVTLLTVDGHVIAIADLAMPDVADEVQQMTDEVIASIEWTDE